MKKTRFLVLALSALVCVSCATLPKSGDPQVFTIEAPTRDPLYQMGSGPRVDSTQIQLISDFLRACQAGASDDYQTARQYLTATAAATWQPEAAVLIYGADESPEVVAPSESEVTVSVHTKGSLDERGELSGADGSEARVGFHLEKNSEGEWRISRLDDGVLLSQPSFLTAFQAVQLYFLAPTQDSLVPDPRWYPSKRLASHLINGLIAGPSAELNDAVYTALNTSMMLPTQGVETGEDQIVNVDLVGSVPEGQAVRDHLAWQVTATLSQVPSTTGVSISLNGVELEPVAPPFGPRMWLDRAVGVEDGIIVVGEGESWSPLGVDTQGSVSHPSIGPASDGVVAWLSDRELVVLRDGDIASTGIITDLPPVVDRWGWVWVVPDGAKQLVAVGPRGEQAQLTNEIVDSGRLRAAAMAPDGVHLALVSGTTGTATVQSVLRDGRGVPVGLGAPEAQQFSGDVYDITWAGATSLAALTGTEEDPDVEILTLGGFVQVATGRSGAVAITGASSTSRIYLQTSDNMLYSRAGALWRPLGKKVADVSFPG